MLVDGGLRGIAAEEGRQLADRSPVGQPGGDVRPLPRVGALREETTKLVERGLRAEDSVGVVVDEPDRVQYFEKWPCCSNASSPEE